MVKKENITGLMLKSHCKLEVLLKNFKVGTDKDVDSISDNFEEFAKELKNHLFVEEEAIFKFIGPMRNEEYQEIIPDLISEHNLLLEKLSDLKEKIVEGNDIDITNFEKLLVQHKNYEEEFFYPQLEEKLEESQKEKIIKKVKKLSIN
jgi:hemerythrin superfamily protein